MPPPNKLRRKDVVKRASRAVFRAVGVDQSQLKRHILFVGNQLRFLAKLGTRDAVRLLPMIGDSQGQLHQDLFVLSQTNLKKGGYFVEFGAANGRHLSNTWLLEQRFGWTGIVAEPARHWRQELTANRRCQI